VRKILVILAAALVASTGTFAAPSVPAARAATSVKVAIIVGATHGTTPQYRTYADEVYAEAVKYSNNVVRVYSPGATASKVKDAVAGASVVVYLGHGNGWPSPYTFDPDYTTKNGFGLNYDANGDGKTTDYENKYYGEPWIDDLRPAPNAVVLLFHLCYASGNPESGPESSLSKAKQRVDNYAAAFLRAGARAVVASGHSHHPYYISALFTTRQTIDQYWRNAPDANGNVSAYESVRNPGTTFQMDPESPGSYYRSVAGKMSLRTQDVTGAPYADTSVDPSAVVVPGNASPAVDGAPVFGSIESAQAGADHVATLGTGARVRVTALEAAASWTDGTPVYRVQAGDVEGWMTGSSLIPRDSAAPQAWEVDDGTGAFSPDGDGTQDAIDVSVRLSEAAAWTLRVVDGDGGGDTLGRAEGRSDMASITWAPPAGSVADGSYRWILEATDGWGNGPLRTDGSVSVDTKAPEVSVAGDAEAVPQFSPNGDGSGDAVTFPVGATEPGSVAATVRDAAGDAVDHVSMGVGSSGGTLAWDGRREDGAYVPDGQYTLAIAARDRAGNRDEAVTRRVAVYAALAGTGVSRDVFFPQDGDRLSATTTFSFRLRSAATVSWTIVDASGTVLRTVKDGQELAAGAQAFAWDGRTDAGAMVPRGTYRTVVRATDGTYTATQAAAVTADAFRIAVSDTTPARGQRITVTAASGEALDAAPRLRVEQPGKAAWSVAMRKVDTRVYRVTITLRSSRTGTLRLRVGAVDDGGRFQATYRSLPLH
jgi:flagellar hook assembly protein FlgD